MPEKETIRSSLRPEIWRRRRSREDHSSHATLSTELSKASLPSLATDWREFVKVGKKQTQLFSITTTYYDLHASPL